MSSTQSSKQRAVLIIASLIVALAGCEKKQQTASAESPPPVAVVTLHRTAVPVNIELPGRTSAYLVAQIRARVDGIVLKRKYQEGSDVHVGQSLYQIDPEPYRIALKNAEAALKKAGANLMATNIQVDRYKVLVEGNAISKQTYDNAIAAQGQAEADVASAKSAVANAKINLGYTEVTAPISGRSSGSLVTQGAYVQGGAATLLTTVQQIDPIYVDLNESSIAGLKLRRDIASGKILQKDANAIRVVLLLEDGSIYDQLGTIEYNGITVDQTTGSVTIRAVFPNPNGVLLPGMFVHARIQQGVNESAFLVPVSAVTHNAKGEATVMTVDVAGVTSVRVVETGTMDKSSWVVTGGVKDGDRVVVSGWQKVQSGVKVTPTEAPAPNSPQTM